jgi:hypothetical protein
VRAVPEGTVTVVDPHPTGHREAATRRSGARWRRRHITRPTEPRRAAVARAGRSGGADAVAATVPTADGLDGAADGRRGARVRRRFDARRRRRIAAIDDPLRHRPGAGGLTIRVGRAGTALARTYGARRLEAGGRHGVAAVHHARGRWACVRALVIAGADGRTGRARTSVARCRRFGRRIGRRCVQNADVLAASVDHRRVCARLTRACVERGHDVSIPSSGVRQVTAGIDACVARSRPIEGRDLAACHEQRCDRRDDREGTPASVTRDPPALPPGAHVRHGGSIALCQGITSPNVRGRTLNARAPRPRHDGIPPSNDRGTPAPPASSRRRLRCAGAR